MKAKKMKYSLKIVKNSFIRKNSSFLISHSIKLIKYLNSQTIRIKELLFHSFFKSCLRSPDGLIEKYR